ncbi:AMP-binding protein [Streptomyces sp. SM10]|uniref:AMP-binding protein n=1 Tax=Streptomyces sp. SM10 TaxID=565556 RepID=UPI0035BC147C
MQQYCCLTTVVKVSGTIEAQSRPGTDPHGPAERTGGGRDHDPATSTRDRTWREIRAEDPLTVVCTSGTTGDPKAVPVTRRSVVVNAPLVLDTEKAPAWAAASRAPRSPIPRPDSNVATTVGPAIPPDSRSRVRRHPRVDPPGTPVRPPGVTTGCATSAPDAPDVTVPLWT